MLPASISDAKPVAGASLMLAVAAALPSAYLAILTGAALTPMRRRSSGGATPAPPASEDIRRSSFAVCIPAHNEEQMIERTIRSLHDQRYPSELYTVHVVADNCTDDTVDVAVRSGARVHDRRDPTHPGKGPALNWLSERLGTEHDVTVIVDADTVVDPGFLAAMDIEFRGTTVVAQGFYGVDQPDVSTAVALRAAALACRHHLRPLGRTRLGCSSGLYGNGMAFRREVLTSHRWSGHLIEDAEMQMELLLDGVRVAYTPGARVAAEMPADLERATTQNQRWERGRFMLARRYLPVLLGRVARGGPLPRRVYADALADHLVPPISLLALVEVIAVTGNCATAGWRRGAAGRLGCALAVGSSLVLVAHVVSALRLVNAPRHVYRALADAPRLVLWKAKLVLDVVRRPHGVDWIRTARNSEAPSL